MESRIEMLKLVVEKLLDQPKMNFLTGDVLTVPGVYVIYDEMDSIIYVGKTNNLKRRILRNHRSGNIRGSAFRKALLKDRGFKNENEVSEYIRYNCTFQYMEVDEDLSAVEHFTIAVLNPKLNR